MAIEFLFREVLEELQVIEQLGSPLLEPDDLWKLQGFRAGLETIRANKIAGAWRLPESAPLRTKSSNGAYEKHPRRGTYPAVRGEFSVLWQIQPLPMAKKKQLPEKFVVAGKASTKLRLVQEDEQGRREFLLWRMEVGDIGSPGSFFHIQLGEDIDGSDLFQPLPVPRLPCPPASPLLALEYMLAELFQDGWPAQLRGDVSRANQWRNLQRPRLEKFFLWQQETLAGRGGSPVTDLKHEIPRQDLLTHDYGFKLR